VASLTADMKRVIREQRLGFCATVNDDGSPNLSPKGTTRVWDDEHICFADICSPQTVANIRRGSLVEINVVDPFVRKGYRFKGPAVLIEAGSTDFAEGLERLRAEDVASIDRVRTIVVVEVQQARALISPAYDDGATTELELVRKYQAYFATLHPPDALT
jgi:predicted pyridoxine 5'-phosphate oxidase superfamily flavin-nucleotide-binding protein